MAAIFLLQLNEIVTKNVSFLIPEINYVYRILAFCMISGDHLLIIRLVSRCFCMKFDDLVII
jgi:hypothetical protein